MHGQGKSNVYGVLPFSYLAGSENPHSGLGLRKEGVYGSRDDISDVYANRSNTRPVNKLPDNNYAGRDSGLGRSNHSTGERGWLPPAGGDPETGIGYDNTGHSELDFISKTRPAPASDNFILKKGPNDPVRSTPVVRSPSPVEELSKGEPISSDYYDPPRARDTDVDQGSGIVDDLERVPRTRPTIFNMAQEGDTDKRNDYDKSAFSSGLSGYPSYVKDPNTRPSTSSDDFNTMIRTDSYMDSHKEQKKCSLCCVIIIVVVTVLLCLGIGFAAGWFGYKAMNSPAQTPAGTTVANGASAIPSSSASSTLTTTTTTTTTTTPAPTQPAPIVTTAAPDSATTV